MKQQRMNFNTQPDVARRPLDAQPLHLGFQTTSKRFLMRPKWNS